jgi:hypothetical protein
MQKAVVETTNKLSAMTVIENEKLKSNVDRKTPARNHATYTAAEFD